MGRRGWSAIPWRRSPATVSTTPCWTRLHDDKPSAAGAVDQRIVRTKTLADLALSVSLVVVTKPSTPSPRQAQAAHTGRGRHIILTCPEDGAFRAMQEATGK